MKVPTKIKGDTDDTKSPIDIKEEDIEKLSAMDVDFELEKYGYETPSDDDDEEPGANIAFNDDADVSRFERLIERKKELKVEEDKKKAEEKMKKTEEKDAREETPSPTFDSPKNTPSSPVTSIDVVHLEWPSHNPTSPVYSPTNITAGPRLYTLFLFSCLFFYL